MRMFGIFWMEKKSPNFSEVLWKDGISVGTLTPYQACVANEKRLQLVRVWDKKRSLATCLKRVILCHQKKRSFWLSQKKMWVFLFQTSPEHWGAMLCNAQATWSFAKTLKPNRDHLHLGTSKWATKKLRPEFVKSIQKGAKMWGTTTLTLRICEKVWVGWFWWFLPRFGGEEVTRRKAHTWNKWQRQPLFA